MRTIKAKPLSIEAFHSYGSFLNVTNPSGNHLGDFFNDHVTFPCGGTLPVAFSSLVIHKAEKMTITAVEYHNTTCEAILAMDDDVVLHVAPPTNEPVPQLTEAFIVPAGTLVKLNTGVWHMGAYPLNKDVAHLLIVLPERIYANDCTVVNYPTEEQMQIEVN